jgi:hypothetical protein
MSDTVNEAPEGLSSVLNKVRKLIDFAEAPVAPGATQAERDASNAEKEAARLRADALMLKYAVSEAMAQGMRPADVRVKPVKIAVELGRWDSDIIAYIGGIADELAVHCRCKIRNYATHRNGVWFANVYGFESDVRYFEHLYTVLRLHMLGVLMPKVESTLSLDENCYRLHSAGYNWLDIAAMYGWGLHARGTGPNKLYRNKHDGEVKTMYQVGSMYKSAYYRAIAARGEQPVKVAAGGVKTYRKSAAQGYYTRMNQRLRAIREGRGTGSELVLASRMDDIEEMFREDNPELFRKIEPSPEDSKPPRKVRQRKYVPPPFNAQAYGTGVRHANTADLGTGVGGAQAKQIG